MANETYADDLIRRLTYPNEVKAGGQIFWRAFKGRAVDIGSGISVTRCFPRILGTEALRKYEVTLEAPSGRFGLCVLAEPLLPSGLDCHADPQTDTEAEPYGADHALIRNGGDATLLPTPDQAKLLAKIATDRGIVVAPVLPSVADAS